MDEAIKKIKAERNIQKLSSEESLELVRKFTRQAFDNESPALREKIAELASKEKERLHALIEACKNGTGEEERTPRDYQR